MKILLIMTILLGCVSSKIAINCPENCNCDKMLNLKRVKCSNQNLMNIDDDIPVSVEVLDVSYNQISELFQNEFENLGMKTIKLLNISHNKIGHMHLNAFNSLNKVRIIDLSFNIIEYILKQWFYDLPKLKELYLSNNNFFNLDHNGPLLESKTLEVLDMSYCKITHLKPEAFTDLPSLTTLKLDGNFLIEVTPSVVKGLKNLKKISIDDNPFNCGKTMNELKRYLKRNVDENYVDPCSRTKMANVERSQKMITLEEPVQTNNLWVYDDDDEITLNTTYCNCTKDNKEKQGIMLDIIEMSPILSTAIIFITGFLLGLIIACNVQIRPAKGNIRRRPKRYSIIRRTYIENSDPLVLNCENVCESTPIPQRRFETYPLH